MGFVLFLLTVIFGGQEAQVHKPVKEPISVTILKVERVRDDRDGNLWYIYKLHFRDNKGILYRVRSECVTNVGSPVSCANLPLPRVGLTYSVFSIDDFLIEFEPEPGKITYEIETEEISDCK